MLKLKTGIALSLFTLTALIASYFGCDRYSAARCVILMIGDGMGFEQVHAASIYLNGRPGTLSFESFPYTGEVTTHTADNSVTDSAAAATAMATGHKVNNGIVSLSFPGEGGELRTLLELYRDEGMRTGLVTTTFVTHATLAAFAAHETSRSRYTQIAEDYLRQTRPNVLLGGGGNGMSVAEAERAGYRVVTNLAEMEELDTMRSERVLGLFGDTNLPYEYDGLGDMPRLSRMTAVALDILDNDPDGYFLLVEGGLIDHACHDHDIIRSIHETIEFNNAVLQVLAWAGNRDDTLIIVTGDHETGGLNIQSSNGAGKYPDVTWMSAGHTGRSVPIYAWGLNAEQISGVMDNTDIFDVISSVLSSEP